MGKVEAGFSGRAQATTRVREEKVEQSKSFRWGFRLAVHLSQSQITPLPKKKCRTLRDTERHTHNRFDYFEIDILFGSPIQRMREIKLSNNYIAPVVNLNLTIYFLLFLDLRGYVSWTKCGAVKAVHDSTFIQLCCTLNARLLCRYQMKTFSKRLANRVN